MPSLTLQDLRNRVYAKLDDNELLYPGPEVDSAIFEAMRILNFSTAFLQTSIQLPIQTQPNRRWYDVPTGIIYPSKVEYEGAFLEKLGLHRIGYLHPQWTKETTQNTGMCVTYWIPFGIKRFIIYPADSVGGSSIVVTGVQEVDITIQLEQATQFPNEVLMAFDSLAAHTLMLKESSQAFSVSSTEYQA